MRLKKVMATGLVAALALSTMVGCSSKKDSSDQKKIGVVQLVEHDALDASYKGFKDGLEKAGYKDGDKIKIEYKNAQNEQSNCQTIAKQFVTDKCDLVLAIATPAAQAMGYWNDPDTLFISMHQDGRTLYPGTGFLPECGGPGALGRTVNIPLPPGTGDEGYLYVTKNVVLPLLEAFKPDLVINSAGQDNHYTDPLTNMQLSAHGYAAMNALLNPHIAVLEGGYSIRGALPYVNLGICLALAGLPFEHVHEPDHDAKALKQRPQVTEYISRLCDDVLNQYHNPPSRPSEGHRDGEWWRRERDIYYDTDGLSEHQNEGIRLCPDCPGLTCIETSSDRVDKSLCLLLPRNACPHCRDLAHRLVETTGKKSGRYAHVLCIGGQ